MIFQENKRALQLLAYSKIADTGFALPLYATSENANSWYVALTEIIGDRNSLIKGFDLFVPMADNFHLLPNESVISRSKGDKWVNVFLFNGVAFVGSREKIISELQISMKHLLKVAPISLLDLYPADKSRHHAQLIKTATAFVTQKINEGAANVWLFENYAKDLIQLRLRQLAKKHSWSSEVLEGISQISIEYSQNKLSFVFPPALLSIKVSTFVRKVALDIISFVSVGVGKQEILFEAEVESRAERSDNTNDHEWNKLAKSLFHYTRERLNRLNPNDGALVGMVENDFVQDAIIATLHKTRKSKKPWKVNSWSFRKFCKNHIKQSINNSLNKRDLEFVSDVDEDFEYDYYDLMAWHED